MGLILPLLRQRSRLVLEMGFGVILLSFDCRVLVERLRDQLRLVRLRQSGRMLLLSLYIRLLSI